MHSARAAGNPGEGNEMAEYELASVG
jgi:hypothetical protein